MNLLSWIADHGFELLEAAGIIGGLAFTAAAFRQDTKARRVGNLLALTAGHRDIWRQVHERPELWRVLEEEVDLVAAPVTNPEALFVTFLLLHLNATHRAIRKGQFSTRQAIEKDVRWFLSRPVPNSVWLEARKLLEDDFVAFVDSNLRDSA